MDKLFDGSDAHLLPGNAELIQRLRKGYGDMYLEAEAADALEAADKRIAEQAEEISKLRMKHLYTCGTTHPEMYKTELDYANQRIAELEAAIIGWKADQKENMATAVEECKRANEAERKLAVAREAFEELGNWDGDLVLKDFCEGVLALIGEDS
ncbi:MAG: hypothetical protein IPL32_17560 [Chloracidobacterium sp.]|nr:hypothetical protein [Chloracidobacterium sp.]